MGLFSFAKDVGRKLGLFGGREDDAAKEALAAAQAAKAQAQAVADATVAHAAVAADIKAAVLSYVSIDDLRVAFDGETVKLSGTAASQADAEKAVLVAGNTEGVGQVNDQLSFPPEPPSAMHTVVKGDTLSKLSLSYYGVIHMYDAIFEANKPMLEHPDLIYPGQVLRIPPQHDPVHTVARGDTLGAIAKHWYGKAQLYTVIYEANTDKLSSPDAVEVGQELRIPQRDPKVGPL